jgi:DNA polymerase-3 subunit epsilon
MTILIMDCETTGLTLHPNAELHKQPRIIELAAALLNKETGDIIETMSVLINPGIALPLLITKITGITDEMLIGERGFLEVLPQISKFFARSDIMFSHNLPFDKSLLEFELRRVNALDEFPMPRREFCTVGLHIEEYGYMPKMQQLYQDKIGVPMSHSHKAHRAMNDVNALCEIIQKERLFAL